MTPKFADIAAQVNYNIYWVYKFESHLYQLRRVFRKQIKQTGSGKAEIDVRRRLGLAALEITVQSLGGSFDLLDDKKEPHPYNKAAVKLL